MEESSGTTPGEANVEAVAAAPQDTSDGGQNENEEYLNILLTMMNEGIEAKDKIKESDITDINGLKPNSITREEIDGIIAAKNENNWASDGSETGSVDNGAGDDVPLESASLMAAPVHLWTIPRCHLIRTLPGAKSKQLKRRQLIGRRSNKMY